MAFPWSKRHLFQLVLTAVEAIQRGVAVRSATLPSDSLLVYYALFKTKQRENKVSTSFTKYYN